MGETDRTGLRHSRGTDGDAAIRLAELGGRGRPKDTDSHGFQPADSLEDMEGENTT